MADTFWEWAQEPGLVVRESYIPDTGDHGVQTVAYRTAAVYSPCERYRYALNWSWDSTAPGLTVIGLNPSTATEIQTDPTVARCIRRARRLGAGSLCMLNLFALRSTDPKGLYGTADPIGPANDDMLRWWCLRPAMILAAWGTHGAYLQRGAVVRDDLDARGHVLYVLGLTKDGHPMHPLYLPYTMAPLRWADVAPARLT